MDIIYVTLERFLETEEISKTVLEDIIAKSNLQFKDSIRVKESFRLTKRDWWETPTIEIFGFFLLKKEMYELEVFLIHSLQRKFPTQKSPTIFTLVLPGGGP